MTIDEHWRADGTRGETYLERLVDVPDAPGAPAASDEETSLRLGVEGELDVELPLEMLTRVMARYGKPLAEGIALAGPRLELAGGTVLCRIRYLARYDVIAKDYLVLARPGEVPLVELCTSIAGALVHLARVALSG